VIRFFTYDRAFGFESSTPRESPMDRSHAASSLNEGSITLIGLVVNAFLVVLKLFAGWFGQSQALVADAVHSISDLLTDGIVLAGLRAGRKGPDERHPFGHARIETLASAFVGIALIGTALYLGLDAGLTIYRHTGTHPTHWALFGAGLSIACKEILYQYTVRVGKRARSTLVVANAWHHRSDALSSVAVFLGVVGTWIHPQWRVLDAYAALLVSFFIVKVGLDTLWNSLREFTDTAPPPEVIDKISACILRTQGVQGVHDLRVRTSGGLYQMETHIVVDGELSVAEGHRIAKDVEACLKEDVKEVERVIIHVDPAEEEGAS